MKKNRKGSGDLMAQQLRTFVLIEDPGSIPAGGHVREVAISNRIYGVQSTK